MEAIDDFHVLGDTNGDTQKEWTEPVSFCVSVSPSVPPTRWKSSINFQRLGILFLLGVNYTNLPYFFFTIMQVLMSEEFLLNGGKSNLLLKFI